MKINTKMGQAQRDEEKARKKLSVESGVDRIGRVIAVMRAPSSLTLSYS